MRRLVGLIATVCIVGCVAYFVTARDKRSGQPDSNAVQADTVQPDARIANVLPRTPAEANKAELKKLINDTIAARHGGALPTALSKADEDAGAQAVAKWKARQAAEKTRRGLDALKVKPLPSDGSAEIALAKQQIAKIMNEPGSAVFGDLFFVNDRKSSAGYYLPIVCGYVNGKNRIGGMTGQRRFVASVSDAAPGVWMEGTTPRATFAAEWKRFCIGPHH
jgi:hypothetical protein